MGYLQISAPSSKQDFFVIVLVTVVTVFTDLAIAVAVGVIASALMFAWEHAKHIYAASHINPDGHKEYHIHGPIFFGSAANFLELFDAHNDPKEVIVDFARSRVADHSAIDAIETLAERYAAVGKTLHLRHLSQDCRALLQKAGSLVKSTLKKIQPTKSLVMFWRGNITKAASRCLVHDGQPSMI